MNIRNATVFAGTVSHTRVMDDDVTCAGDDHQPNLTYTFRDHRRQHAFITINKKIVFNSRQTVAQQIS